MSESDFMDMTKNGELCNENGGIGSREFESIMRGELIAYIQVPCQRVEGVNSEKEKNHSFSLCNLKEINAIYLIAG
jgi:hypothetical protein